MILKGRKKEVLFMMILIIMLYTSYGCSKTNQIETNQTKQEQETMTDNIKVLGEGQTKFMFSVVDKDGKESKFEINTDKKTVGEALLDVDMISGDKGEYGLYVKTVNGITIDYNVDKAYWAFYVNGEYGTAGVDMTEIEEGKTYSFRIEK